MQIIGSIFFFKNVIFRQLKIQKFEKVYQNKWQNLDDIVVKLNTNSFIWPFEGAVVELKMCSRISAQPGRRARKLL